VIWSINQTYQADQEKPILSVAFVPSADSLSFLIASSFQLNFLFESAIFDRVGETYLSIERIEN
jgi:hypothetical protein